MSQYHCCICGLPITPDHNISRRLAIVWLKGKSNVIDSVEDELYKYRHEFCESKEIEFIQPALF